MAITPPRSFSRCFASPHKIGGPVRWGQVGRGSRCVASSTNQTELELKSGRAVRPGPAGHGGPPPPRLGCPTGPTLAVPSAKLRPWSGHTSAESTLWLFLSRRNADVNSEARDTSQRSEDLEVARQVWTPKTTDCRRASRWGADQMVSWEFSLHLRTEEPKGCLEALFGRNFRLPGEAKTS